MSKTGKVSRFVQNMVDKGYLKYEINPDDGKLQVTQGENYHKAPWHFRAMFEDRMFPKHLSGSVGN